MPIELVLLSNHLILYRTNTSNYTLSWSFFLLTSKSLRLQFINNGFTHNIGSMFKTVVPVQTLANQINVTDNLEINSVLCNKKYTNQWKNRLFNDNIRTTGQSFGKKLNEISTSFLTSNNNKKNINSNNYFCITAIMNLFIESNA